MIGQTLGPYEVLAKLGEGGMGEVYRARDTHLARDVAMGIGRISWTLSPCRQAAGSPRPPPGRHRAGGWIECREFPDVREYTLDAAGTWSRLDGDGDVAVEGRFIGGCIETLCNVAGTPYGDVAAFAGTYAPEGLLIYVEAAGHDAFTICRNLHGMRLAGFFHAANAILVGRTSAASTDSLTQHDAGLDALGPLGVPIIADVECGHVPPFLPFVNGARGRVVYTATRHEVLQTLD